MGLGLSAARACVEVYIIRFSGRDTNACAMKPILTLITADVEPESTDIARMKSDYEIQNHVDQAMKQWRQQLITVSTDQKDNESDPMGVL